MIIKISKKYSIEINFRIINREMIKPKNSGLFIPNFWDMLGMYPIIRNWKQRCPANQESWWWKLNSIKEVREKYNIGLKEAKDAVEYIIMKRKM